MKVFKRENRMTNLTGRPHKRWDQKPLMEAVTTWEEKVLND